MNGNPIELLQPETLRYKIFEPVLLVGREKFQGIDIRIRVKGGGHTSQVYGECLPLLSSYAVLNVYIHHAHPSARLFISCHPP